MGFKQPIERYGGSAEAPTRANYWDGGRFVLVLAELVVGVIVYGLLTVR